MAHSLRGPAGFTPPVSANRLKGPGGASVYVLGRTLTISSYDLADTPTCPNAKTVFIVGATSRWRLTTTPGPIRTDAVSSCRALSQHPERTNRALFRGQHCKDIRLSKNAGELHNNLEPFKNRFPEEARFGVSSRRVRFSTKRFSDLSTSPYQSRGRQ